MSSHRFLFYVENVTPKSGGLVLEGEEHHHLTRVLRCRVGDRVYVTNGRGLILECLVRQIGSSSAQVETESVFEDEKPGPALILALALLKKDKFEQALEQCVELGITRCIPYISQKSQLKSYANSYMARLRKIALAAMKQSFRAFLPEIDAPVTFERLLQTNRSTARVVVGEQGSGPVRPPVGTGGVMAVIGPEAGFDDRERTALAEAGADFVSVSPFRLRSETAAVALIAALAHLN